MLFRGQSIEALMPKAADAPPGVSGCADGGFSDGTFVLTTYDGCLVGYPAPLWNELEERFGRLRNSSRKIRDFAVWCSAARRINLDAQGRIRLSRAHVEYAGLEHDASWSDRATSLNMGSGPVQGSALTGF